MIFPSQMDQAVNVERAIPGAVVSGEEKRGGWTPVLNGFPCLIETITTIDQESLVGRVSQAKWNITWIPALAPTLLVGGQVADILEDDRITWVSGNGKIYIVKEIQDCTPPLYGGYKCGVLIEKRTG